MNSATFWEVARGVYSIALLALGVAFLLVLPKMLQAAQQLAEAISFHAATMKRDAENDARILQISTDVKTIKADVESIKKAA